jgi:hypothetical protein
MQSKLPEELIAAFSRNANFPRDKAGLEALSSGLRRASEQSGVEMPDIVERCAVTSPYCPTDFDLVAAARAIKRDRTKTTVPMMTEQINCEVCQDTGWEVLRRGEYTGSRRCAAGCKVPQSCL